jgi:mono/diheme cytochrome c family protein
MLNGSKVLVVAALLSVGAACNSGRYTSAGFRLPADGNPERGRQAFVNLGCNSCHAVQGVDLPKPTVQPPVPVTLGGEVDEKLSDAYLVTSMIYPSYELAPYPKDQITSGGVSRMPNYADKLTVRQMVDVVAFLQSRYVVRQTPQYYGMR